jgi:hypothetical protein
VGGNAARPEARVAPFCRSWSSRFSGLYMLDDLNDRAELIEPWVGFVLSLSIFVLALGLLL